jgi:predicted NUDIX family NTP pyrophosphohydrolase
LQSTSEPGADDFALRIHNRFRTAADNVAVAQARIGVQLDACSRPAEVKVGDYMYLDGKHVQPLKFAVRWFGPFKVLAARGPVVQVDLPPTLGKMSPWVNVRRLKFFEECDVDLAGPDDGLVLPLISPVADDHDPVMRLRRFCGIGR